MIKASSRDHLQDSASPVWGSDQDGTSPPHEPARRGTKRLRWLVQLAACTLTLGAYYAKVRMEGLPGGTHSVRIGDGF
jgi:hypothetical protein